MSTQNNKVTVEITQTKESKKIADANAQAMAGLTAIFKGEKNIATTTKIPNGELDGLVEEIAKEEIEGLKIQFKNGAKALFKSKVEYDRFITQKKQEFQKTIDAKTKEFTNEANRLLGLVENIGQVKADYAATLTTTTDE